MNCAFTIVAKNYIPLATILGESLIKNTKDVNFFIFVVDKDLNDIYETPFQVIDVSKLNIAEDKFQEMAFKYNITEFCTSVKPFCFQYVFNEGYDKALYFDPDIFVYNNLEPIYNRLDNTDIILTPHISEMQETYTGFVNEGNVLFAGIYNLGFCAIKNSQIGNNIIGWWKDRLINLCYADRIDGLHTDQKWIDFIPSILERDNYFIYRSLGCNVAYWNWHERKLINENGTWFVKSRNNKISIKKEPLLFFHFSTYSYKDAHDINKFMPFPFKLKSEYNDIMEISIEYSKLLIEKQLPVSLGSYSYPYNCFSNGKSILSFHRRLYKRLLQENKSLNDPFNNEGEFYLLLEKSNLLPKNDLSVDKLNENNYKGFSTKYKLIKMVFKFMKIVLGINKYSLLLKFLSRFVRVENQTFLLSNKEYDFPFYNETRFLEK